MPLPPTCSWMGKCFTFSSAHWEDFLSPISIYGQHQHTKLTQLWTCLNFFLLHQLVLGKYPVSPGLWVEEEMLSATVVDAMEGFTTCLCDLLVSFQLQMYHFHQMIYCCFVFSTLWLYVLIIPTSLWEALVVYSSGVSWSDTQALLRVRNKPGLFCKHRMVSAAGSMALL